jgi:xanthine dehydrogenase small subunit
MAETPQIALNGVPTAITQVPLSSTLLDWLRDHARLRGTKEGCAEGDCGACVVVVERLGSDGQLQRQAINSCLTMVGQVDGLGVRTVEGLRSPEGALHPIQAALAAGAATQCGFCTPGFVMSAFAFAHSGGARELSGLHDALAGNLCRCTGYRPIVDAIASSLPLDVDTTEQDEVLRDALRAVSRSGSRHFQLGSQQFHAPSSLTEALALREKYPEAVILAGGTDLGLLVSQKREKLPLVIYLGNVRELSRTETNLTELVIGAGVTYTQAMDLLVSRFPQVRSYWTRIGSPPIRNMGTIGGNIGTASPIGDTLPILLALDASVLLSSRRGSRSLAVKDFFQGYRKTALQPDELIELVRIPTAPPGAVFFVDKVSKRRDQDISSICGAYSLHLEGGVIRDARLAFGGLAAIPQRAAKAEAALDGQPLDEATFAAAADALRDDFQPITDWRGSAEYRMLVARNLMRRLAVRLLQPAIPTECHAL